MSGADLPPEEEDVEPGPGEPNFGQWLDGEMRRQGLTIRELSNRTGITYTGLWNIVVGNTVSPREGTRRKLEAAVNSQPPVEVELAVEKAGAIAGYDWVDFTPSDLETVPEQSGVYVFYDITDRPVYVGKSSKNVRTRVKDHSTRFWFKRPLVVRGAFLSISDPALCGTIEMVLIKFLGKHALLNEKGVVRDLDE